MTHPLYKGGSYGARKKNPLVWALADQDSFPRFPKNDPWTSNYDFQLNLAFLELAFFTVVIWTQPSYRLSMEKIAGEWQKLLKNSGPSIPETIPLARRK